jgi:hypothetical protein
VGFSDSNTEPWAMNLFISCVRDFSRILSLQNTTLQKNLELSPLHKNWNIMEFLYKLILFMLQLILEPFTNATTYK